MQPRPLFLCCVKSQIPVSVAPALCFAQHLSLQSLCSSPFPVAMGTSLFVLHTVTFEYELYFLSWDTTWPREPIPTPERF